jgi:hypothetical protein
MTNLILNICCVQSVLANIFAVLAVNVSAKMIWSISKIAMKLFVIIAQNESVVDAIAAVNGIMITISRMFI